MKLKKEANGIMVKEPNYELAIAEDGNLREMWFKGRLKELKNILDSPQCLGEVKEDKDFLSEPIFSSSNPDEYFAEKLVEDLK